MKLKLLTGFTLICISIQSAWSDSIFPGPLVTADWLSEHIDQVLVLDTRKELDSFTKLGHIENSILVDVNNIRIDREIEGKKLTRMRPDPDSFEKFMREHGVNKDSKVVITHRGETPGQLAGASRLYWHFKYYNFDNVAILDGGNAAWVAALEDLTDEVSTITPGNYTVGSSDESIVATMAQVKQALENKNITLIDTRELRYHIGVDKKDYVFAHGHIPGSRNLPYKFFNPAKGTAVFFAREKLKDIVDALAIDTRNELILYCNSAYECASDWFVLHELLGIQDVRVYDGSLHQWTQYPENPMTSKITH